MTQQFYVSKDRTIRGPVTDRKKHTVNGRVQFTGTAGVVYTSHDEKGNPKPLPAGFVEYAKGKKESNGHTLMENLIANGSIVFEPGATSPANFAKAFRPDLIADPKGGAVVEDKDPKAATK